MKINELLAVIGTYNEVSDIHQDVTTLIDMLQGYMRLGFDANHNESATLLSACLIELMFQLERWKTEGGGL